MLNLYKQQINVVNYSVAAEQNIGHQLFINSRVQLNSAPRHLQLNTNQ